MGESVVTRIARAGRRLGSALAALGLARCAQPQPVATVPPPVDVPAVSVVPPAPVVSAPPPPPAAAPHVPAPPPPHLVSAAAAIVWTEDSKALGGFRSALVEQSPEGARVVVERGEVILASAKDLWVLRIKKTSWPGCAECDKCMTEPPTCKKNDAHPVEEPLLKSLRTGRVLEPWQKSFKSSGGCAGALASEEEAVTLTGAVGPVFFAEVSRSVMGCGAAHPGYASEPLAFDLDTEAAVTLSFPEQATPALRDAAHAELGHGDCVMDPDEKPAPYEATAEYGADGVLHGVYAFTMSAPYVCGTGPGHYSVLSTQKSPWIPSELSPYGKLPVFISAFMSSRKAVFAMPIAEARVAAAEKEMLQR